MAQQHFLPREQPRPLMPAGTWIEVFLAAVALAALAGFCAVMLWWLGPHWPRGLLWFLFAAIAWFAASSLVPRLAVLLRWARRLDRELLIRTGPFKRRMDLGRISRVFDRGRLLELHTHRGAMLIRKDHLAGPSGELIRHWRALRAGSGVRSLSPPVKSVLGRIDLADLALAALIWASTVVLATATGSAGGALWIWLGGAFGLLIWAWVVGRPRLAWMTPKAVHVYRGGRSREFELRQVEWFGWRSIRGGAAVELHGDSQRLELRCHEADAALLCNMVQWRAPGACQVDLGEGRAYPGPRMRGAPALLAERIIARVGSRDRRSLLIHVVQAVCFVLLGGLQTLYGWSEPDTRWTVIVYGVLSLMVGMLLTGAVILGWMHMRNRARNIHDSVAHAVEPVEVDRRIHALTQDG